MSQIWNQFLTQVVNPGNCTSCGACAGLNPSVLEMRTSDGVPLPCVRSGLAIADTPELKLAWAVCPGRGVPYPELFEHLGVEWNDKLLGPVNELLIAHASDESIRRNAASGGILSRVLIELLESGQVNGCVVVRQGIPTPEEASPVIATSREDILAAAQSVYRVTPMLAALPRFREIAGPLAFVGLPDQVAALRMLQAAGHPAACKFIFVAGPYTGTNLRAGAIRAFLRMHRVPDSMQVRSIRWRAGEWPGYLEVVTEDGNVYRAHKFYYNYLIPFYIAPSSLITPDFTNELTDLSVGDAWSPRYERAGGGYSVVSVRTPAAKLMMDRLMEKGEVRGYKTDRADAFAMHAHMIDFKKRGTFLRLESRRKAGVPIPSFGYWPIQLSRKRRWVERIIFTAFRIGGSRWARKTISRVPLGIVGPAFNIVRRTWKQTSKSIKRGGLADCEFTITRDPSRWQEIFERG